MSIKWEELWLCKYFSMQSFQLNYVSLSIQTTAIQVGCYRPLRKSIFHPQSAKNNKTTDRLICFVHIFFFLFCSNFFRYCKYFISSKILLMNILILFAYIFLYSILIGKSYEKLIRMFVRFIYPFIIKWAKIVNIYICMYVGRYIYIYDLENCSNDFHKIWYYIYFEHEKMT